MARRGRKRKITARRRQTTRSGQGRLESAATPEAYAKKIEALGYAAACSVRSGRVVAIDPAGVEVDLMGADATPLGALLARGLITQDQHDAGLSYAVLYWWAIGRPYPAIGGYRDVSRGSLPAIHQIDPDDDARREKLFNRLSDALDRAGRDASMAAKSLAVDGEWPSDVFMSDGLGKSRWPLKSAVIGLQAIVNYRRGD